MFLGPSPVILRPFRPVDLSPLLRETRFGFRLTRDSEERTLGVGLITEALVASRGPGDLLGRTEFQSGFFDAYWAFVTAEADAAERLSSGLDRIGVDRVGVLRMSRGGWELIRPPSLTPPIPDRRHLLRPDPAGPEEGPSP